MEQGLQVQTAKSSRQERAFKEVGESPRGWRVVRGGRGKRLDPAGLRTPGRVLFLAGKEGKARRWCAVYTRGQALPRGPGGLLRSGVRNYCPWSNHTCCL